MIYYKDNEYHIATELVKYIQHNEEIEQFIGQEGRQWWIDFETMWEHTEILSITEMVVPQEQLDRLEQVNQLSLPDGFTTVIELYVKDGVFVDGVSHPLRAIELEQIITEQAIELSEREINEIMMGMQISDMEIQLLELGGK